MIISFIPLAELRYPSMAGFPIVSLVAITGTYYNNCNIIAPKFVQNEWHYTENNLIKFYKEEYNQGYIKSIKFLENNLNSTSTNYLFRKLCLLLV